MFLKHFDLKTCPFYKSGWRDFFFLYFCVLLLGDNKKKKKKTMTSLTLFGGLRYHSSQLGDFSQLKIGNLDQKTPHET
jgi:hypothetical protein